MAIHLLQPLRLERLKPDAGKTEAMFSDGGGLWLRVRPTARTWLFIYTRPTGGRGKLTLGDYPDHSLQDARAWAQDQRRRIDQDIDPGVQRSAAKTTQRALATKTLGMLLDGYVAHLRRLGRVSAGQVERSLRPIGENLRKMPAATVTTDDLMPPIRKLSTAGKLRAAGILRSNLAAAFNVAIKAVKNSATSADMLGFGVTRNPAAEIEPVAGGQGHDSPEETVIPDDVIRAYRKKLTKLQPGACRDVLMLHLLSGQRVEQIVAATVEGGDLVLTDRKGKGGRPRRHVVPMTPVMQAIVEAGSFAVSASYVCKRVKSLSGYTVRDVRRTMSTKLAALGVISDVEKKLLSHGQTGVVLRHYNMHTYRAEKLAALTAWQKWLDTEERCH